MNSFGRVFRVSIYGESHGASVGAVIDGCPPGLELSSADLQHDLDRRKPGQSRFTTQRREDDEVQILSGVFEGKQVTYVVQHFGTTADALPAKIAAERIHSVVVAPQENGVSSSYPFVWNATDTIVKDTSFILFIKSFLLKFSCESIILKLILASLSLMDK